MKTGIVRTASNNEDSLGTATVVSGIVVEPTGLEATMSLGSVTIPNVGVPLTGLEMTASVGELSPATVTGVTLDAMTASTGSVIIESKYAVTGVAATASLGTITEIADQIVGLSLDAMTARPVELAQQAPAWLNERSSDASPDEAVQ